MIDAGDCETVGGYFSASPVAEEVKARFVIDNKNSTSSARLKDASTKRIGSGCDSSTALLKVKQLGQERISLRGRQEGQGKAEG